MGVLVANELLTAMYGQDCSERVQPMLEEMYSGLVERMWKLLGHAEGETPKLRVVHSPYAKPAVGVDGKSSILIYDQYLGQVFNKLTRIELTKATGLAVRVYFLKLAAQRFFINGRLGGAAVLVQAFRAVDQSGESVDLPREEENQLQVRAALAHFQEVFAVAHELGHLHLETRQGGEELDSREAFIRKTASSLAAIWRFDGVSKLMDADDAKLWRTRSEEVLKELDDPSALEEMVCDHLAWTLMARAYPALAYTYCAGGAYLGLVHLRAIQYLDNVALSCGEQEPSDPYYNRSILRAAIMRYSIQVKSTQFLDANSLESHSVFMEWLASASFDLVSDPLFNIPFMKIVDYNEALVDRMDESLLTLPRPGWMDLLGFHPVPRITHESLAPYLGNGTLTEQQVQDLFASEG